MENTDTSTDKRLENLRPAWQKGQSGNPNGRPKGRRNFETIFYDALENLAKKNNMDALSLETEIVEKALLSARKGDARFYKDLMDRIHGTALQSIDHTSGGMPLSVIVPKEVAEAFNIDETHTKTDGGNKE